MATVRSHLSNMHNNGLMSSETLRAIEEMSITLSQFVIPVRDVYHTFAQVSNVLSPYLIEANRLSQRLYQTIYPALLLYNEASIKLTKFITPSVLAAVDIANRMQFELQPLLKEFHDISPSIYQVSELIQTLSAYADDRIFSAETMDEIASLTVTEKYEVSQAISLIIADPDNWEHALIRRLSSFRGHHPKLAKAIIAIIGIITAIVINVTSSVLYDTIKSTKLRTEPTQNAPVVIVIKAFQTVNIINSVSYYYEVEYTDPETGETYSGWVSKISVQESTRSTLDVEPESHE